MNSEKRSFGRVLVKNLIGCCFPDWKEYLKSLKGYVFFVYSNQCESLPNGEVDLTIRIRGLRFRKKEKK